MALRRRGPAALACLVGGMAASMVAVPRVGGATAPEAARVVARAESALAGRALPDIPLTFGDGRILPLSALWRDKPLLVTLYYRRCAGSCAPFLEWVRDAVGRVGGLGRDYRVLALTFDDTETTADLRGQAAALRLLDAPDWHFAGASKADVSRIAQALDFRYELDPRTRQYDHNSLLIGVEQGKVVRALLGTPQGSARLRELVWELRGSFVSVYQVPGRSALRCLRFDPVTGRIRFDWGLLLLILPALCALAATLALFAGGARRADAASGGKPS